MSTSSSSSLIHTPSTTSSVISPTDFYHMRHLFKKNMMENDDDDGDDDNDDNEEGLDDDLGSTSTTSSYNSSSSSSSSSTSFEYNSSDDEDDDNDDDIFNQPFLHYLPHNNNSSANFTNKKNFTGSLSTNSFFSNNSITSNTSSTGGNSQELHVDEVASMLNSMRFMAQAASSASSAETNTSARMKKNKATKSATNLLVGSSPSSSSSKKLYSSILQKPLSHQNGLRYYQDVTHHNHPMKQQGQEQKCPPKITSVPNLAAVARSWEKKISAITPPSPIQSTSQQQQPKVVDAATTASDGSSLVVSIASSSLSTFASTLPQKNNNNSLNKNDPNTKLLSILQQNGYTQPHLIPYSPHSSSYPSDFFNQTITPEAVAAYSVEMVHAIASADLDHLRSMKQQQQQNNFHCCNSFGETLVHVACRRGLTNVVKWLVDEAGVSIRTRDDFGRTPMHDACWTSFAPSPCRSCCADDDDGKEEEDDDNKCQEDKQKKQQHHPMEVLIQTCPDLLLVCDKRGFAPLHYVRTEHWDVWCKFLEKMKDWIRPRFLLQDAMVTTTDTTVRDRKES